eukprot:GHVT01098992.1.p1 GENE.GHVT01098992.1~~GHVT01098992.1.p1  ORF type:complete len:126 (-),score=29.43 GHVT01098992.1:353-730(-)
MSTGRGNLPGPLGALGAWSSRRAQPLYDLCHVGRPRRASVTRTLAAEGVETADSNDADDEGGDNQDDDDDEEQGAVGRGTPDRQQSNLPRVYIVAPAPTGVNSVHPIRKHARRAAGQEEKIIIRS